MWSQLKSSESIIWHYGYFMQQCMLDFKFTKIWKIKWLDRIIIQKLTVTSDLRAVITRKIWSCKYVKLIYALQLLCIVEGIDKSYISENNAPLYGIYIPVIFKLSIICKRCTSRYHWSTVWQVIMLYSFKWWSFSQTEKFDW